MRSVFLVPFLALVLCAVGCGGGNLGDIWRTFPETAFGDPGEGEGPDGEPTPFTPVEVAAIAGGQGVSGNVRNVAVGEADGVTYAFLSAGTAGVHIVDVNEPDLLNATDFVATIPPGLIAGGRADAIAAIDNSFLVIGAVGSGAANAVTIFLIPTLIDAALTGGDIAATVLPLAAGAAGIAIPGNAAGKGGGISGGSGILFVATGGPTLATATIDATSGTWMEGTALVTTAATTEITDVQVNATLAVYASSQQEAGTFGFLALSHPLSPFPTPPNFIEIEGEFERFATDTIAGPGNFPLDFGIDGLTLYVTGDDQVIAYNITNPIGPTVLTTIDMTGLDTIAARADGGTVAVGAGNALRLFTNFAGQTRDLGTVSFSGTFTIRGVAITSTDRGAFALCCAGEGGMRVVQVTEATPQ